MPSILTYEDISDYFSINGCELLTTEYKNNLQILKYKALCGHIDERSLKNFKLSNFSCRDCNKNRHIPKIEKLIHKMDRLYGMTHKYRDDFTPENYDKTIKCWDCGREKFIRFFPYRKQYSNNKDNRCKECNRKNGKHRRENLSKEQMVNVLIKTSKASTVKRQHLDDNSHTITKKDVYDLYEKQNGKCVYTGRQLKFEANNIDKMSIDRIDSTKGYTPDNIQLVVWFANQAKSSATDEEFKQFIYDCYHNLY